MPEPIPSVPDRFALIFKLLRDSVAHAGGKRWLAAPLVIPIWKKINNIAVRFAALAAMAAAGTLPAPRRRRSQSPNPRPRPPLPPAQNGVADHGPANNAPRLPRRFGWLLPMVPGAAIARSQLRYLLAQPEIAALLDAHPQLQKLLRPLCWMLGLRVPKSWQRTRLPKPPQPEPAPLVCAPPPPLDQVPEPQAGPQPPIRPAKRRPIKWEPEIAEAIRALRNLKPSKSLKPA